MLTTIQRRNPLADIIIIPTIVQGDRAPASIIKAITYVNEHNLADVMIVGRGGGSIEDLWAFNDERVARCVYASHIPIVSSVGHETDFTIIDFVSDKRAPTPTAAGEFVTPELSYYQDQVNNMINQLHYMLKQQVETCKIHLQKLMDNQYLQNPLLNIRIDFDQLVQKFINQTNRIARDVSNNRVILLNYEDQLPKLIKNYFDNQNSTLTHYYQQLDSLNPLTILSRGYSVMSHNEQIIRSVNDVSVGTQVDIKLKDGHIKATIDAIKGEV